MADEDTTQTEEVMETPAAAEAAATVPTEEKKVEETSVEPVKEESKVEAKKKEKAAPTGKFADLIKEIEHLSVLELSELVKALEDRFGVTAAAPMMMGAMPAGAGAAAPAEAAEEKTHYTLVLTEGGTQKIAVIKAIREILPDLGLKEAKDLVDGAPKTVKENMPKADAEEGKKKLEAAGGKAELK